MEYLKITDPEWQTMWEQLAEDPRNGGDPVCVLAGQGWEYMGSTLDHHHLRHPCHPGSGKPEYAYIERARAAVAWA